MRNRLLTLYTALISACLTMVISPAWAIPPLEVYGNLPSMRAVEVSPDGKLLGYINRSDGVEALLVYDFDKQQPLGGVRTDNVKARYMSFAGPDHAILHASENTRVSGFRGKINFSAAFSYGIKTNSVKQLLRGTANLYPAQTGLGIIKGLHEDGEQVFMPAFTGLSSPVNSLMRVDLNTARGRIHRRGNENTIDWIVDASGTVLAREDYDNKKDTYKIFGSPDGNLKEIFKRTEAKIPPISLVGIKPDKSALIIAYNSARSNADTLAELSFDGEVSAPIFTRRNADARALRNQNQVVIGVEYSGLYPSYEFFDQELTQTMKQVADLFAPAAVSLTSWSNDLSRLVLHVSGGNLPPSFYFFNTKTSQIAKVADQYVDLTEKDMAQVLTINYKARDGQRIPAVLTLPRGWSPETKYPTIIMPHGGPESYDAVSFDWMAQFFASRGYIVLQPNFRGSDGFGADFLLEGRGQWGRGVMQHDVTDGLKALIKTGWADPERACIVGWSYGGYAALAGGAFTPELYKCVVAIAPVSHLPRVLLDEKRDNGKDSWVLTYWSRLIGDPKKERDKLEHLSPALHAEKFQAPVLLIHGKDDLVVPIIQSTIMEKALLKAGKQVEFMSFKGEDHSLSSSESRVAALRALDTFVRASIGDGILVPE